jgi:hypothetical protein
MAIIIKRNPIRPNQYRIKFAPAERQAGIATGCLVAVIAVILIFGAIGVYVAGNYQTWLAQGIAAGMQAVIETTDLPQQEKSEITEIIDQIKNGYLNKEISLEELGLILESMSGSPVIPIGLVTQFEESYVVPSGLNSDEKAAANLNLNRLARGISNEQIGWETVDEILAPISDLGEDGNQHLRSPAEVSDDDIRQVLVVVQRTADEAEVTDEKIEVDISDEFKKSVEIALGREIW